jgi:catechol 2,3-dioxygenase-like lactoylglutathione lyase family enzyme
MRRSTHAMTMLLGVVSMVIPALAHAQETAVGILNSGHAVNNLDTTLAFYRDVFGLVADPQPMRNPGIAALTGTPSVELRHAVIRLPNTSFGFELTEFSGAQRVRDLDSVVDAARKSRVQIVTPSAAPVKLRPTARGSRAILMRDPDGYFVEGEDVSSSNEPPSTENVQSAGMRFAMADREATIRFYGNLLGFKLTGNTNFGVNVAMASFTGVPEGSLLRGLSGLFPGTDDSIAFYEFKDLPRTPLHPHVQDPGAPALSLRVKDLDGLLKRLRAAGVPVVSARGEVVQFTATIRNILVEDPNGIHIELFEQKQ